MSKNLRHKAQEPDPHPLPGAVEYLDRPIAALSKNKKAGKKRNPNRPRSKNSPVGKRNDPQID